MSEEAIEQVAQVEAPMLETPAEVASGGSGNDFLNMIPEELRGILAFHLSKMLRTWRGHM